MYVCSISSQNSEAGVSEWWWWNEKRGLSERFLIDGNKDVSLMSQSVEGSYYFDTIPINRQSQQHCQIRHHFLSYLSLSLSLSFRNLTKLCWRWGCCHVWCSGHSWLGLWIWRNPFTPHHCQSVLSKPPLPKIKLLNTCFSVGLWHIIISAREEKNNNTATPREKADYLGCTFVLCVYLCHLFFYKENVTYNNMLIKCYM